ncbi:MAG: Chemotaxis protein CheV [Labilithrix sp.]|jgi:CheY-like chemotaxis protein|nr:Chemotaxis protein CheV [Labilithrix sp.]
MRVESKPSKGRRVPLVLVVDDYDDTRALYVQTLRVAGFDVAEAANGLDAVDMASLIAPDFVVMDLAMPVMDGWDAIRRIKTNPRTKRIRVMAVTGHCAAEHRTRAAHAGCDDFFAKPFAPEQLVSRIRRYLAAA